MSEQELWERLARALTFDLPYYRGGNPFTPNKQAAVLVLFHIGQSGPSILMTKRTDHVESHKGQMAFPGGMVERHDKSEGDPLKAAAKRETEEEVGISSQHYDVVGALPEIRIPSGFEVTPFVALGRKKEAVSYTHLTLPTSG